MSTQIQYMMENLYKKQLITKYRILGHENAKIWVNESSLHLFVVDDRYEISIADIKDALLIQPKVDYLVYNTWQGITSAAEKEAQSSELSLMSFGRFCYLLEDMGKLDETGD